MQTLKRLIRWLLVGALVFGTLRFVRTRLVPQPVPPQAEPPRFRVPPEEPPPAEAEPDDLEEIHGIGPVFARRLHTAEILTFAELATADAATVAAAVGAREDQVAAWIEEAQARTTPAS